MGAAGVAAARVRRILAAVALAQLHRVERGIDQRRRRNRDIARQRLDGAGLVRDRAARRDVHVALRGERAAQVPHVRRVDGQRLARRHRAGRLLPRDGLDGRRAVVRAIGTGHAPLAGAHLDVMDTLVGERAGRGDGHLARRRHVPGIGQVTGASQGEIAPRGDLASLAKLVDGR
ncbi:hypothetical protein D3C72_911910 [compost metagenome]